MTAAKAQHTVDHRLSATYLDHDHRKRENIRFFAVCASIQDLWRSPSRGMAVLKRAAPRGIQALSDRGEAKIRDACVAEVVYKNIVLTWH
jgi:hypothetical protein